MKAPVSRFTVHGNSMFPTLGNGQDVLSFNWAYLAKLPKTGDIVVIKQSGKEMVKRVQKVQGHLVSVQGDNMKESTDSRHFGPISMNQIVGKVVGNPNIHQSDHI